MKTKDLREKSVEELTALLDEQHVNVQKLPKCFLKVQKAHPKMGFLRLT